jgi:hypothetical protein
VSARTASTGGKPVATEVLGDPGLRVTINLDNAACSIRGLSKRRSWIREVPTVKLAHHSDAEERAYILADNRLAEKAGELITWLLLEPNSSV